MDKGKKPMQEEEDFLSFLDYYQPNEIITPLAPPEYSVLSQGSELDGAAGSAKETPPLVDEMEGAGEDFFSQFVSLNFTDDPPNLEHCSVVPPSNTAFVPDAQADEDLLLQLPPKASVRSKAPAAAANSKLTAFRKTMPPRDLEKLALLDPKRAKRIMTNRLSALRAKERKKLYVFMLEHKLQTLQAKSTKMSARLTILQKESNSLKAENNMLTDQMDGFVQQIRLHDSLNDQIRSEIQHMKNMLRPFPSNDGSFGASSQNNSPAMMNAPLVTQQPQCDFEQSYLGKYNFGVQSELGELSQLKQLQQQQQHPKPCNPYQVRNEVVRTTPPSTRTTAFTLL